MLSIFEHITFLAVIAVNVPCSAFLHYLEYQNGSIDFLMFNKVQNIVFIFAQALSAVLVQVANTKIYTERLSQRW